MYVSTWGTKGIENAQVIRFDCLEPRNVVTRSLIGDWL